LDGIFDLGKCMCQRTIMSSVIQRESHGGASVPGPPFPTAAMWVKFRCALFAVEGNHAGGEKNPKFVARRGRSESDDATGSLGSETASWERYGR
jgi:hypothetical protein